MPELTCLEDTELIDNMVETRKTGDTEEGREGKKGRE